MSKPTFSDYSYAATVALRYHRHLVHLNFSVSSYALRFTNTYSYADLSVLLGLGCRELLTVGSVEVPMRFCQLDQITLFEPGIRIEASRRLRADEDYLRDHFPRFAVMPGVLMLESLTQAATLLARATEGYQSGLIYLESAKSIKFADFVQPGEVLLISAEIIKRTGDTTLLKVTGRKEASVAVSGRLVLKHKMLSGTHLPSTVDRHANAFMKRLTDRLLREPALAKSSS